MKTSEIKKVTFAGLSANLFLSFFKIFLGLAAASQALVADGIHSLSDLLSDLAIIFGVRFWERPPDETHPYGHGRLETFVSAFIGILIMATALYIAYNSLSTLYDGHRRPGAAAFWAAFVSIAVKEFLYRWTLKKGISLKSSSLKANAWHHRSDALSSIPVALAILASSVKPEWAVIDHVGAFFVSVFIFYSGVKIIKPAFSEFADASASLPEKEKIREAAMRTDGVVSVHKLRTRKVSERVFLDIHLQVDPEISVRRGHEISGAAKRNILESCDNVADIIIHIEPCEEETE